MQGFSPDRAWKKKKFATNGSEQWAEQCFYKLTPGGEETDEGGHWEEEDGGSGEDEEPEYVQCGRRRDVQSLQPQNSHPQGKKKKPHVDPANAAAGLFSHHQSHLWILYKKWMFVRYVVLNYGCKVNLQSRTRRINFGIVIIETLELRLTRVGDAKLTCVKYYIQFVFHWYTVSWHLWHIICAT